MNIKQLSFLKPDLKKLKRKKLKEYVQEPFIVFIVFVIGLLPIISVITVSFFRFQTLSNLEEEIEEMETKISRFASNQKMKNDFFQKYSQADHFYLEKNLERKMLLEGEIRGLEKVLLHPAFHNSEPIKEQLESLKNGENRLRFTEVYRDKHSGIEEVEERQLTPAIIDWEDLQNILSTVEGIKIGSYLPSSQSPQLFFKRFDLRKEFFTENKQGFLLEMELIKRECCE